MVKKTNNILKQAFAIGATALLGGAGLMTGVYLNNQNSLITNLNAKIESINGVKNDLLLENKDLVLKYNELVEKHNNLSEEFNNIEPVIINNTINETIIREVIKENGNYSFLIDELYDNNGDISFAYERLDEEDRNEVIDRIILISNLKDEGKNELYDEFFYEIHRLSIDIGNNETYKFDKSDLEKLDIEEDIEVTETNFRFNDFTFKYTGTFRDEDNNRFEFDVEVDFKDSKFDKISNINVTKI